MTSNVVYMINKIIDKYRIASVLDLPCGDFNWMKLVDLANVDYVGGDIVEDLIQSNIKNYSTSSISFEHINLTEDELPQADLIIVRDCLSHFSYEYILKAVNNIKRSKCKYLLVTTFTKQRINYDIVTGDWRSFNLQSKPFNFPKPLELKGKTIMKSTKYIAEVNRWHSGR